MVLKEKTIKSIYSVFSIRIFYHAFYAVNDSRFVAVPHIHIAEDQLSLTDRCFIYEFAALSKAVDSGQKLIENSNIKDSKYYKAAKVTLDEAIDVAENWVDRQASKAQ